MFYYSLVITVKIVRFILDELVYYWKHYFYFIMKEQGRCNSLTVLLCNCFHMVQFFIKFKSYKILNLCMIDIPYSVRVNSVFTLSSVFSCFPAFMRVFLGSFSFCWKLFLVYLFISYCSIHAEFSIVVCLKNAFILLNI